MAKKSPENMSLNKEFVKIFDELAYKYGRHRVWSDFIYMSACAISNSTDLRVSLCNKRETEYAGIVSRYDESEIKGFSSMLASVMWALQENPEQDFLGSTFSLLNLHNEWNGQFFTPYHIGSLMAKLNIGDPAEMKNDSGEPITVCDPCCGAGCLLIAYFNSTKKAGIDVSRDVIMFAQDIDRIAALMCYIQLSLLGCSAVIKIGNSLTEPLTVESLSDYAEDDSIWLTPCFSTKCIEHIIAGGETNERT